MELQEYLESHDPKVLNLGCGKTCPEEHYGIDVVEHEKVDKVWDLTNGIPIKSEEDNGIFDTVYATDFLEHIPQGEACVRIMEEIYRVLKPGGELHACVPSTSGNNLGAFQDPYHLSFWNKQKFFYFLDEEVTQSFRSLYEIKCWFEPKMLETFYNEHEVAYVMAILKKRE